MNTETTKNTATKKAQPLVSEIETAAKAIIYEAQKMTRDPDFNWGHVGSLTHLRDLLNEAHGFISGNDELADGHA